MSAVAKVVLIVALAGLAVGAVAVVVVLYPAMVSL